ncbi:DEAD/DEAH box helicase family protein [Romboutsia hominis]|uniref:DEAD/DEAH box helicase family protein n=1 Tax=Romboutsia hominis TaxID=1507512 RepID=UPI001F06DCE7|nr:DEAD/DEAH box helicase family protein [Romboutsia hominis]MCH1959930.1 DEAD/DEAH box helicase family protein [Romboutsia hominis]MCH1969647.1 DEAD/DEAH box helicase family protein [Romboutsia hominis]
MNLNINCITGHNDHLYKRIQQSIHTASSIDIIVSFLMESGVKLIQKDLETIKNKNIPIRILTGNYLNITQPSALYLIKDILGDNVDLRFYNDTKRSFHAKAYIFEKENEGEIFIGSSNLSRSALTSGIEWNYRIDKKANHDDFKYFKDVFEDLFHNESIIVNDIELEKYSKIWKKPKIYASINNDKEDINYVYEENNKVTSIFEPRGAQIEALYELKKTRLDGNDKGLVVAATGIGKTYLAAFDSREFNRVLFVAHREEILKQAYDSFKNVRTDKCINDTEVYDKVADNIENSLPSNTYNEDGYNMGFFMNSIKDNDKDIIFASVQSLGKKEYLNKKYFSKDYFDYIVIDEFHHAVSKNYQNIINYFEPKFMLGLTATPDRLDNKDVFSVCDYNTVYEATLKTAIDKGFLVPFRYYGIYDDSIDYNDVEYKNGKYNDKELEKALSINNRANLILNHYKKYKSSRALGFCTSKSHAEFMAKYFNENGIPSCAVYSGSDGEYNEERSIALDRLRKEEINVIFSVDMFNEGLDIKSIDMVMFLRPTESPTIFLQQLGRGLRKDKNKKYLNVLDFIGNYKKANLVPYLLTGESKTKESSSKLYLQEDDYPEDCIIDFDFRLIDIFERMRKESQKIEDMIKEEFYNIKRDLGHRPSRLELFTYMDDDLYNNIKKKAKINPFRDYISFSEKLNELNEDEKIITDTIAYDFIKFIENTSMSKTYKLPVLLAFYNNGNMKLKVDDEGLYKSFKDFYSKGSNKVDMLKDKSTSKFETWEQKQYVNLARKNPVHFLCKSSSEFFYLDGDYVCLNEELGKYLDNESFIKNIKDAIDFRNKEYYKNRFKNK